MITNHLPPLYYDPIVAGSTFAPLPILLVGANGTPLNMTGAVVTVRIVDEQTGQVIVEDRAADIVQPVTLGRADFYLQAADFDAFTGPTTWLVQWQVVSPLGAPTKEPAHAIRLPVHAPI